MAIAAGNARGVPAQAISQPASLVAAGVSMTPEQTRQSVQWLSDQLMLHVPRKMDGDDNWGETKKMWAGVKLRRDGWELKTNRRWKELRHGRWVRYEIELPARSVSTEKTAATIGENFTPDHANRSPDRVEIHSVSSVSTPNGDRRWQIDASVSTPARFRVRLERWNLGGKWYSIEITGTMSLHLRTTLTMALQADFAEVPPAMQLDVAIEQASLTLSGFEVERISKLGGDVAEEIGDLAENTIAKIWIRKENARLARRFNEAIQDNRDSLRWSMADWLAQLAR